MYFAQGLSSHLYFRVESTIEGRLKYTLHFRVDCLQLRAGYIHGRIYYLVGKIANFHSILQFSGSIFIQLEWFLDQWVRIQIPHRMNTKTSRKFKNKIRPQFSGHLFSHLGCQWSNLGSTGQNAYCMRKRARRKDHEAYITIYYWGPNGPELPKYIKGMHQLKWVSVRG